MSGFDPRVRLARPLAEAGGVTSRVVVSKYLYTRVPTEPCDAAAVGVHFPVGVTPFDSSSARNSAAAFEGLASGSISSVQSRWAAPAIPPGLGGGFRCPSARR